MWGAKMSGGIYQIWRISSFVILIEENPIFLSYLKNILFSGRRKRWQSTWQAMLKSSEAWAPRHRFFKPLNVSIYFKSVWLFSWLPGVRATSSCWRSLSGHGLSIPWVALSSLGDRQTRQAPQTTCYWKKFRASSKKRGFSEIYFALSLAFLWCGFCSYISACSNNKYTIYWWHLILSCP